MLGADGRVDCRVVFCLAEVGHHLWVSQLSGNASERVQRIALGGNYQKHDVDRTAVDCLEINRLSQAREEAKWLPQVPKACVRDRHPATHPRRPEFLALQNGIRDQVGGKLQARGRSTGELSQQLDLVEHPGLDHRVIWREKVVDVHL